MNSLPADPFLARNAIFPGGRLRGEPKERLQGRLRRKIIDSPGHQGHYDTIQLWSYLMSVEPNDALLS